MARLNNYEKTKRLVGLAILTAIVAILQALSPIVPLPVSMTFALTPIILGAAIYGKWAGAYLGSVFGLIAYIMGVLGRDGFTAFLIYFTNKDSIFSIDSLMVLFVCLFKGAAAGFVSGVIFKLFSKKNELTASFAAGAACSIVNTGIFVIFAISFFVPHLEAFSAAYFSGTAVVPLVFFTLAGINFIAEFLINMVLAVVIARIIKVVKIQS